MSPLESTHLVQMAGPHTCRNAGGAPTNDSSTPVPIPALFHAPTIAPAQTLAPTEASAPTQAPIPTSASAPTPAPAPAFVPGPPGRYMNKRLQKTTKLALELFLKGQKHSKLQASSEAKDPMTRFKRVSQHQQESMLEWAAHLKHLQLILLAYEPVRAPAKPTMLRYFQKNLRPSILAKPQNEDL